MTFEVFRRERRGVGVVGGGFLSLSLSVNGSEGNQSYVPESQEILEQHEGKVLERCDDGCKEKENVGMKGSGALNMTKHLWAGAVAAMVSRFGLFFFILFAHEHVVNPTYMDKTLLLLLLFAIWSNE